MAVALVPRGRHLAAELAAGAPPVAGHGLRAVAQPRIQLLAGRAGAAVAIRRVVAGKLAAIKRSCAVVLGTE